MLAIRNLQVVYGGSVEAVRDVSLEVPAGRIVALLGSNGAGKSTVLKAISQVLDAEDGEIEKGTIALEGHPIRDVSTDRIVRMGLVQVPEGRRLFGTLSVEENLVVGAHLQSRAALAESREFVFRLFPKLLDRRDQIAGYLSGGEQQMVAIGRALMAKPRLMLLDEPSLGLAPLLVQNIFEIIRRINKEGGVSILVVEQNANVALKTAEYAYVMENGRIVLDGEASQLAQNADIKEFYLGLTQVGERKSYRDVKHYKRRKRWIG